MLFELKLFLNKIKKYKTVYIVGKGVRARALKKFLESVDIYVNNLLNFEELNIIPKDFFENLIINETVFIYEQDYDLKSIPSYLKHQKLKIEKDLCNTKTLLRSCEKKLNFIEIDNSMMSQIQRQLVPLKPEDFGFEVNVSEHCNLNCKMCNHFSPISNKEFYSLEQYTKDISRLAELFNHKLHHVTLLGGEPLLNPQLESYIKVTREKFPDTNISVHTNGILLQNAENLKWGNFWKICKEYDVNIMYTIYPLKIDYKKIETNAQKYGVTTYSFVNAANVQDKQDKMLTRIPLSLNKNADPEDYIVCYALNLCTSLRDGKIYPCPTVSNIYKINEKFNVDFKVTEDDYIDIYKIQSPIELCNFICTRIPFCTYCQHKIYNCDSPWQRSNKESSEWICDTQETDFDYHLEKLKKSQKSNSLIVFDENFLSTSFILYNELKINCFIDNDICKQGKTISGAKVYPVDYLLAHKNYYILIVSSHYNQMKSQLLSMNISEDKIIDGRLLFRSDKLKIS